MRDVLIAFASIIGLALVAMWISVAAGMFAQQEWHGAGLAVLCAAIMWALTLKVAGD